jgi:hypothetical protein
MALEPCDASLARGIPDGLQEEVADREQLAGLYACSDPLRADNGRRRPGLQQHGTPGQECEGWAMT